MFIGHFTVGLASKRVVPQVPLGYLLAAPLLLDLLWPLFLLMGLEQVEIAPGDTAFTPLHFTSYPYSHSLLTSVVWAALFAALYWRHKRDAKGALVIAIGVVSHWVCDFITYRPDLPLYPGISPLLGLGLWNSVIATVIVENALFVIAVWLYHSATQTRDRIGAYAFWAFVAFAMITYTANLLGPPPPNVTALTWVALTLWLLPFWANWFDRHRVLKN